MHLIDLQTMQFGRRHRFTFVTISISAIAEFTDRIIPSTLKATDTKKLEVDNLHFAVLPTLPILLLKNKHWNFGNVPFEF